VPEVGSEPSCDIATATGTLPKTGCPRCGKDVAGRALVMHLKTCYSSVPQVIHVESFNRIDTSQANVRSPLVTRTCMRPTSPPLLARVRQDEGSPKTQAARQNVDAVSVVDPGASTLAMAEVSQPNLEFEAELAPAESQLPCPHCGRTFREKALQRHIGVCVKINRERKVFNTMQHALPAEAVQAHKQAEKQVAKQKANRGGQSDAIQPAAQVPAWKAKSDAFQQAIKDARAATKAQKEGKPLPPTRLTAPELDDRIPCPHCGRRFGEAQAQRHIPICPKGRGKCNRR